MDYLINIFIVISQILNTIIAGEPDQTVSARAYHNRKKLKWSFVYRNLNRVFFWQKDHCYASACADLKNAKKIVHLWPESHNKEN